MSQINQLSDSDLIALAQQYHQKWIDVFSMPIDQQCAAATVKSLYQQAGYRPPKIVFLDSPLAIMIAAADLFGSSGFEQQIHEDFVAQWNQYNQQIFQAFCSQRVFRWYILRISGRLENDVSQAEYEVRAIKEDDWDDWDVNKYDRYPYYKFPSTELDITCDLLYGPSSVASLNYYTHWYSNIYSQPQLERLNAQLNRQLGVSVNLPRSKTWFETAAIKPIGNIHISKLAAYDAAIAIGFQVDVEPFTLLLNSALHLGFVSPFREVCFVSDRPQIKRDSQGKLHAIREPAIQFLDGFSMGTFHNGIELPAHYALSPSSCWSAQQILEEPNAHVRRMLIEEMGYARLCQELQAEELDSWREYTLLRLPIYDDFSRAVFWRKPFHRTDGVEPTHLLKMSCPSTKSMYVLRVPPNLKSAREAATWINWESDPESFTIET